MRDPDHPDARGDVASSGKPCAFRLDLAGKQSD